MSTPNSDDELTVSWSVIEAICGPVGESVATKLTDITSAVRGMLKTAKLRPGLVSPWAVSQLNRFLRRLQTAEVGCKPGVAAVIECDFYALVHSEPALTRLYFHVSQHEIVKIAAAKLKELEDVSRRRRLTDGERVNANTLRTYLAAARDWVNPL